MIGYKDFAPGETRPGGWFKGPEYESFEAAVAAANEWITQNGVTVIQIETVVLPNIGSPGEQSTADAHLGPDTNTGRYYWYQFVRVWYRTVET